MSLSRTFGANRLFQNIKHDLKTPENIPLESYADDLHTQHGSLLRSIPINGREVNSNKSMFQGEKLVNSDETSIGEEMCSFKEVEVSRSIKDDSESVSIPGDDGEPLKSQYLEIDFSPITGVDDDEYNLNKCSEFWKFIDEHPEIHELKVMPENYDFVGSDTFVSRSATVRTNTSTTSEVTEVSPIAVVALNCLKKGNVMSDSLATKKDMFCEPVLEAYDEYCQKQTEHVPTRKKYRQRDSKPHIPISATDKSDPAQKIQPVNDLAQMIAQMHKWDLEHPKSMEPPGHAPTLIHANMISDKNILRYIDKRNEKSCYC